MRRHRFPGQPEDKRPAIDGSKKEDVRMKWILPVILAAALMAGLPVSAEFYKYYDEDGNVHFTDDYNQIPLDQREDVEGYEESISEDLPPEEAEETAEEIDTAEAEEEVEEEGETADSEAYDVGAKADEFEQRKAEVEEEYQSLVKEKERLDQIRKDIKTQKQLKASGYNESVKALNEKMKEHDQKRQQLISEIQQHNARLSQDKAARSEPTAKKEEQD